MGVEEAQFRCEKTGFGLALTRKDRKATFVRFPFSVTARASALQALSMLLCVHMHAVVSQSEGGKMLL